MSSTKNIRLVALGVDAIHGLAQGDLEAANRSAPVALTPFFLEPGEARVWQRRSRQIAQRPADLRWITRAIVDTDRDSTVGRAGFHGAPDSDGMVEVGYAVDPLQRRRGYARAALHELLAWAGREPGVRTVRASARPDNEPSINLILQCGFIEVGEQWDDEDGRELIFEIPSRP